MWAALFIITYYVNESLPSFTFSSSSSASFCSRCLSSCSCSCFAPNDLRIREIEETDGTDGRSIRPSLSNFSRISQLKIPGFSFWISRIFFSMSGVATRGLEPPVEPGFIEPVSWYLKVVLVLLHNTLIQFTSFLLWLKKHGSSVDILAKVDH